MTRTERTLCAGLAILAGAFIGLALADAVKAPQLTFEQRWQPADTLPPMRDYSPIMPEQRDSKSDRGPCVNRRPRCQFA